MPERNSEGGGSFPLNLQTLLILLMLASSVWFVAQGLTSTRPAASVGIGRGSPGEQNVEARLWEDPFKTLEQHRKSEDLPMPRFTGLLDHLKARDRKCSAGIILPVMISGGPYSEDQESRIRTRFAIVSALSQSGYVSEDSEHLGSVTLQWPTTKGIKSLKEKATADPSQSVADILIKSSSNETSTLVDLRHERYPLDLRYEWYRLRDFHPHRPNDRRRTDDLYCPYVLVLWLNERDFEDEPLLRLPLLLGPVMEAVLATKGAPRLALIGPGLSSTLRAMLPIWETGKVPLKSEFPQLWQKITGILQHIEMYSATATAMDEILVQNGTNDPSREGVREALEKIGFKSFRNFVATDDQLAQEILNELDLRGIDFTKVNKQGALVNHLVLLSEWDTFYARMLSLTYAAELAMRQGTVKNRAQFVKQYRHNLKPWPSNLHPFVYLRGLDGQTMGNETGSARASGSPDAARTRPTSLEDLNKWTPDANKAEGSAQFDYLSRLGEQLAALEDVRSAKGEHIKAIGIVGSDVYDTLLILQALRHRFPHVFFFTTGLDARFWHPRERPWSRNLIVASSYGLSLHPKLQKAVPFFRDSTQTAQYAATLAALEPPKLSSLTVVPPRRFEIGRYGAVDLSMLPIPELEAMLMTSNFEELLPSSPSRNITSRTYVGIGIIGLMAVLLLTLFCRPLRRLMWESSRLQADTLQYREEDVGGIEGALTVVLRLQKSAQDQQDRLAQWLVEEFKRIKVGVSCQWPPADARQQEEQSVGESPEHNYTVLLDRIEKAKQSLDKEETKAEAKAEALQEIERCKEELLRGWLDFLNRVLHRKSRHPGDAVEHTTLLHENLKVEWECWWPEQEGRDPERPEAPQRLRQGRDILDALLQKLGEEASKAGASPEPDEQEDILKKAQAARDASLELYGLRRRWVWQIRILALAIFLLVIRLGVVISYDSLPNTSGEPFSLTTGTSAWPAEILRFAAFALAISLSFQSYQSLQTMVFQLTRRFRLPLVSDSHVHASDSQKPKRLPAKIVKLWQCFKHRKHHLATIWHWLNRTCRRPAPPEPGAVVHASKLWEDYQQHSIFMSRFWRIFCLFGLYIVFCIGLILVDKSEMLRPLRGPTVMRYDSIILYLAVISFLFLTFMIIDAVRLCRWFIQHLSEVPTEYPLAATNHFSRLRGLVDRRYLDEWIDLQLIADLTEHVGRLIYYPFIVFFLLLLARNDWWDRWPWSWSLIIIFVGNLTLAAASAVILQTTARKAKNEAEAALEAKVKRLQAAAAESPAVNNAYQAERLLEEIRNLRRGAFVPFWENPVLGAALLPSGGAAAFQILMLLLNSSYASLW